VEESLSPQEFRGTINKAIFRAAVKVETRKVKGRVVREETRKEKLERRDEEAPPSPMGVGEGWGMGNCYRPQARDGSLGGIPAAAISGPLLRYTIGLESTTPAQECLFNIEHWRDEDDCAVRGFVRVLI
jgi:hypothetical protein